LSEISWSQAQVAFLETPDDGLALEVITGKNGVYQLMRIPGVGQGAFEVPSEGVSIGGRMEDAAELFNQHGYCNFIDTAWTFRKCDDVYDANRENVWSGDCSRRCFRLREFC
jgi:hypothetical protein